MTNSSSFLGVNLDQFLKVPNYEDTVKQLDIYYGIVKRQILKYQSPTTGLYPVLSSDHQVGSVRESVYCTAAVWGLHQAYRRIDDDRGKSYELGQSAVKCMRGILECWIRQARRIELFKKNQCNTHALHVKFDLVTGNEVYSDEEYNHLQIDVVSIYLLFLVQIITSGLQIIYTQDEVAFVQNLVYYVERAYRTPDYGMWERGTKYNDGTPEIHSSSIGLAKAALEVINGCNLFGGQGASWSVVYVDIDAHNRNRSIFETLLPRESSSKEVDVSLLSTISFPTFSTHDEVLYNQTKRNIVQSLKGRYGFKRFSQDGFKTVLEDTNLCSLRFLRGQRGRMSHLSTAQSCRLPHVRMNSMGISETIIGTRYYEKGEIKRFENLECEWPLFYMYMIIDGVFKSLPEQISEYQNLLKQTMYLDYSGDPVIPMYYYVPKEHIGLTDFEPTSAEKVAASDQGIFLWNQAMFVLAQLLTAGLLHINELDPVRRYLPSYNRPRKGGRYSAFQGTATDLVVQIVLIAESTRLQAMMATYGIQTQTPHEVEPIQIWSSSQLVKVYENLGVNKKLGLTGRPVRPVGSLGTSKVYRICGSTVLCYPLIFEVSEFYLYRDMALLIDDIKTELQFVGRYWRLSGRPTMCLLVREEHMRDPQFKQMVDLFAMLKKGYCDDVKVRIGRLQNLISSSCIEHLDFMDSIDLPLEMFKPFKQLEHDYIGYQSLTDVPRVLTFHDDKIDFNSYNGKSIKDVLDALLHFEDLYSKSRLLGLLQKREGSQFKIHDVTVEDHLKRLYHQAGCQRHWAAVRFCSSLLSHTVDSISPFITAVLVHGKQRVMYVIEPTDTDQGHVGDPKICRFSATLLDTMLHSQEVIGHGSTAVALPKSVLVKITVGVIGEKETVFDKPMTPSEIQTVVYNTIQPYSIIEAVLQQEVILYCGRLISTNPELFQGILKIRAGWVVEALRLYLTFVASTKKLEDHSPYEVRLLLHRILSINEWNTSQQLTPQQERQLEGCLCRVPITFYDQVWDIMTRTPHGVKVLGNVIPQYPTLLNMTRSEITFSLLVEQMLNYIQQPDHRQLIVELLCIVSTILTRNPELSFTQPLDLEQLINDATHMLTLDHESNEDRGWTLHRIPYIQSTGYLARAVVNTVLKGGQLTANGKQEFASCKLC